MTGSLAELRGMRVGVYRLIWGGACGNLNNYLLHKRKFRLCTEPVDNSVEELRTCAATPCQISTYAA